ncbi:hypothetical protein BRAS3843_620036 [Bradyrhizobium sp. STM 3843]|uniref:hypothetical protein n=1 Tax=Bradyrhizobium sp. STM 3843 TaxID=551947 RepID=UPI00024049EC|nr:hypothetical protein [Bradyrhizobium sp. STM 3843]CCE11082.1 hypothetical protein BRAS3843_620036 [Bradyrhizobium sp. STM 3843]
MGHKDSAATKKLAGPRQFGGDAFGMPNRGAPGGALESDPVLTQAVSIDDVKEVSHPR